MLDAGSWMLVEDPVFSGDEIRIFKILKFVSSFYGWMCNIYRGVKK
jgi:hypothetical protein